MWKAPVLPADGNGLDLFQAARIKHRYRAANDGNDGARLRVVSLKNKACPGPCPGQARLDDFESARGDFR